MEIKPNILPAIPAGDVRGPAAKDGLSRGVQPTGFTDSPHAPLPAQGASPSATDPGALRLAEDPWTNITSGTRLLLPTQAAAPEGVDQMPLPDAVRSAIDFIFADLP